MTNNKKPSNWKMLEKYDELHHAGHEMLSQSDRLWEAAIELYMAGRWECSTIPVDKQVELWTMLRDALGLEEGTASAAGVGGTGDKQ